MQSRVRVVRWLNAHTVCMHQWLLHVQLPM